MWKIPTTKPCHCLRQAPYQSLLHKQLQNQEASITLLAHTFGSSFSGVALGILLLLSSACVKNTAVTPHIPGAPSAPALEKTFGQISFSKTGQSGEIVYKNIRLLFGVPDTLPTNPIDYVLLDTINPSHEPKALQQFHKDQKILLSTLDMPLLKKFSFSQTKPLQHEQKVLLKKDNNFLFVTALHGKNKLSQLEQVGYFLEFDNGRNILITAGITETDSLRPFLYDLRDEGKEIHLGLMAYDSSTVVDMIALFQPKVATIMTSSPLDLQKLAQPLSEAFFQGQLIQANEKTPLEF